MTAHARAPIDGDILARVVAGRLKASGLSLRRAAPVVGVSFNSLGRAARGESVDLATYVLICRWLGVSLDTFVEPAGVQPVIPRAAT